MSVLFFKIHRAKSKSVPCYPFFNLLSKIRPSILLCQNPSPGTSGYLEKILPSGLQNLPSGRLRTALGQILESLGQDFFQNPLDRGWIFYQNSASSIPGVVERPELLGAHAEGLAGAVDAALLDVLGARLHDLLVHAQ